jgi:hypothetical protein
VVTGAFVFGVASVAAGIWWLAGNQGATLRGLTLIFFVVQLALLAVAAVWALIALVWK